MFESLKKKFSGWLKKEPEKKDKEKAPSAPPKAVQEKKIKGKKKEIKKEKKKARGEQEVKEEVEVEEEFLPEKQDTLAIEEEVQETKESDLETPKEELREEFESVEKVGFFYKLKTKLSTSVLNQEQFDELFEEFETILLENNVALGVVDKIHDSLSKDLVGISVKKKDIEKTITESLRSSVLEILIEPPNLLEKIKKSLDLQIILFFGINGSGKTTSVAKLAYKLKRQGISCVLTAGDTFRAASIEQLEKHAKKIGVPIVKSRYGADPASVAFDAISYARKHKIKVVLIDTAGRMYTKANLLKEMEKIVRIAKPSLKLFVGESITGNDVTEQARTFNKSVGIDGIILTKADIDEKAGAILSVSHVTGKPIYFLGVGQGYEDLKDFKKGDVLDGLGLS